jgi:hypothetical protein
LNFVNDRRKKKEEKKKNEKKRENLLYGASGGFVKVKVEDKIVLKDPEFPSPPSRMNNRRDKISGIISVLFCVSIFISIFVE